MIPFINDAITKLQDPARGHGPQTIGILAKAVTAKSTGVPPKFTACYDPHGQPSLEHFKDYIRHVTPPARIHIPLALQRNHITALVIDIDSEGKSDALFFNSLGTSNDGYTREAQLFIDAVREKFPKKQDHVVTKQFQDLSKGDGYCGDWSMWFLQRAAATPTRPLRELASDFNNMPERDIPNPQRLREEHITDLERYKTILRASNNTPVDTTPPVPAEPPKIKIKNEAAADLYIENILKSHNKSININIFADDASKKQIIKSSLKFSENHHESPLRLAGDGLKHLTAEAKSEYQLARAREIIQEGYRTGKVDLDNVHGREMKKLILQTFLSEFGPDASKGTPPRFVGHGIIKINLEIIKEKNEKAVAKEESPELDLGQAQTLKS